MRISAHYNLGRRQPELDFVDIDIRGDVPVFISPRALRLLESEWGHECVSLVQHFFRVVLGLIRDGQDADAEQLLRTLREPNETHLGLSRADARSRGLGSGSAHDVWHALSRSEAAKSGLLEELEDTILMVEGISVDMISDITTNIIRAPLIRYTQAVCTEYGIPLENEVASGPLWDPGASQWYAGFTSLPVADGGKMLLVPKAVVRRHAEYDPNEYFRHYLLDRSSTVDGWDRAVLRAN